MKSALTITCTFVLVASLSACKYDPPAEGRADVPPTTTRAAPAAGAPAAQQPSPALPPGHPAVDLSGGPPATPASVPAANLLRGEVVETMDAAGYTYLRLRGARGELWVAVSQAKVAKGEIVTVAAQMTMKDFESQSLNRKFDVIVFGTLVGPAGTAPAGAPNAMSPAGMPPGHPVADGGSMLAMPGMSAMTGGASKVQPGEIKVAKAEGTDGRTVEEIWVTHTALKDKQVMIRGKVVKFLPEIMGKNWIHLQDGSGSPEARTNDITVTTTDKAAAGDIVVVTGTIRTDVNLGAGYSYPVMIEDAKLKK